MSKTASTHHGEVTYTKVVNVQLEDEVSNPVFKEKTALFDIDVNMELSAGATVSQSPTDSIAKLSSPGKKIIFRDFVNQNYTISIFFTVIFKQSHCRCTQPFLGILRYCFLVWVSVLISARCCDFLLNITRSGPSKSITPICGFRLLGV
jgi:hypothetical protein